MSKVISQIFWSLSPLQYKAYLARWRWSSERVCSMQMICNIIMCIAHIIFLFLLWWSAKTAWNRISRISKHSNFICFYSYIFAEEEIDVVSVGDKNLPTNPSAKDRRALQTTVAHKITARIVKTTSCTGTPRRRVSDESSDDSAYSSKGSNYSETTATSPSTTSPMRHSFHLTPNGGSRKRINPTSSQHSAKRSKSSKKLISNNVITASSPPSVESLSKHDSSFDNDEIETIEKRNLHNDMERQRRIGLKNLFENLKEKIPSLREKERAPKVNILREATLLCNNLTREDNEYEALKKRQQRLVQRLKQLRGTN